MAQLDVSRDIYHAIDNAEDSVSVERSQENDNNIVLGFEGIDIVVDDFQAAEIMQKLSVFFNYQLVDSDA